MNRIKELRIDKNWTQAELGCMLGVNQTAIGKYERGELEPNIETLKKLCIIFDCSIDYLIGFADEFGNITITPGTDFSAEEIQLVKDYRELTPALKEMLHGILSSWKPAQANGESAQRGNRRA